MNSNRALPDPVTTELLGWIRESTERLCRSSEGLTEEQVRIPVAPSGWTVAGLLGHVHDSTWFWLHHVLAGNPLAFSEEDVWDDHPDLSLGALQHRLRTDTARACSGVEHLPSGAVPAWWPEGAWGGYRQETVRGVLLHLLVDDTAHTGHLDIVREQLDGSVWDHALGGLRRPD
ncbi:DinB family protein [Auraticoccus monumenti]|uniref:Uncharacterized damage-inducible protein DinB (Forms a four-helix bundle) n=1 Tax=Auraticoccus monumenti TaxID=675864 RepID=A0A1G6V5C0_9ACTN|nr:DinB family protein [Auraticoccus monumenti]SDD48829.1 Uncharacterized damage-inducible protein DinB (forms a four-helix bundle) [Auraticoccus monumenti]